MKFIVTIPDDQLDEVLPNLNAEETAGELEATIESDLGIEGVVVHPFNAE